MGSMSASDAAPLPRLGEVYFDVRGESRSMRLSWYADTGVAVFSIWQGGTCTGTFRLPMADLPRMIEALQHGPQPHGDTGGAESPLGDPRAAELHTMPGQRGMAGQHSMPEQDTTSRYGSAGYGPDDHGRHEQARAAYPGEGPSGGPGGYRGQHGDSDDDEPPTGVYRGDPLGQDRRDDSLPGAYRDDPLSDSYPDEPHDGGHHGGGYGDDSLPGGYRDGPHGGPYRAESLPGGYRADLHGGHYDDPLPAGHPDEPRGGGHRADWREDDYPANPLTASYSGEHTSGYPGEHTSGYPEDRHGGYAGEPGTARYRAEPPTGDYPTGPSDPAIDDPDYPAPGGHAGYSPARPYVAPASGGRRGTGEGRGPRRDDGEESDPSADSFPYGYTPDEPEARGRGR